jgi:serine phosphatase RsbU (regulator of sigma subunit)
MLTEDKTDAAVLQLNSQLHLAGLSDRFITLAACRLDPARHTVTLVIAGHVPPLIYRKATGKIEEAAPRELIGYPLGVVDGMPYEAFQMSLQPGDLILTFTDGVTEARNKQEAEFRMEGVHAALKEGPYTPQKVGEKVVKAVKQHALGCKQHDDITVVCFGRTS